MRLYTGDLKPDLTLTITDDGVAVDLTVATSVTVIGYLDGVQKFSRAATVTAQGLATMAWVAGDTTTAGVIYLEVVIDWPGAKPQTIRPNEVVEIVARY